MSPTNSMCVYKSEIHLYFTFFNQVYFSFVVVFCNTIDYKYLENYLKEHLQINTLSIKRFIVQCDFSSESMWQGSYSTHLNLFQINRVNTAPAEGYLTQESGGSTNENICFVEKHAFSLTF